jgi:multidrug resistance efflux pump
VAENEKDLEKLSGKTKEATAKKEKEEVNYEPLDLLVQQAADRQNAIVEQEKVAQETLNEAKAAVETAKVALKEHRVPPSAVCTH